MCNCGIDITGTRVPGQIQSVSDGQEEVHSVETSMANYCPTQISGADYTQERTRATDRLIGECITSGPPLWSNDCDTIRNPLQESPC